MRSLVVAAVLLAGCSDPVWTVVHSGLSSALYDVTGTSATDVWAVGGDDGTGPLVLRFEGTTWRRVATGAHGDLWWLHPTGRGRGVVGGANGQVLSVDGDTFTPIATPGQDTVFGVWVDPQGVIWAVGGDTATRGFAWKREGNVWTDLPLPDPTQTVYKVWGSAADDVWLCGTGGVVLHWDGVKLTETNAALHGSDRPLFTISGSGSLRATVGGFAQASILEWNGSTWADVAPTGLPRLSGVVLSGDGGWAVGGRNTIVARVDGAWVREDVSVADVRDLHAVWRDPSGGVWAAGGELTAPSTAGLLLHKGDAIPSTIAAD